MYQIVVSWFWLASHKDLCLVLCSVFLLFGFIHMKNVK
uniref:Uncharacterized protein n=1 Tax=Arundo donax TaxID=35708 RepID=A0A0A9HDW5_ARUDO